VCERGFRRTHEARAHSTPRAQQLFFANSSLCDDLSKKNPRCCDALEAILSKQGTHTHTHASHATVTLAPASFLRLRHRLPDYLCGTEFTLADAATATHLAWIPYFTKADPAWVPFATRWPALGAYAARVLAARPAGAASVPLAWLDDTAAWLV
jgi:glutathione S-transferase